MKQYFENRLNMFGTVLLVLASNAAVVALRPALGVAQTALLAVVAAIESADLAQRKNIKGVTVNKQQLHDGLVNQTFSVASAMKAYAHVIGDAVLFDEVSIAKSKLKRLDDGLLPQTAQFMHDRANGLILLLADYGITAPVLTTFQTAITNYKGSVDQPREAVADRMAQTNLIPVLNKQGMDLIKNEMTPIIETLLSSEPVFYDTYFAAKEVIDSGQTHTTVKGKATDSVTGDGIFKMQVEMIGTNTDLKTTTDVTGVYQISKFKGGVYSFVFTHPDFKPAKVPNVKIPLGGSVEVSVVMEKV